MKIISTTLASVCLLSLAACGNLQNWNSSYLSGGDYLSNDDGMVIDCYGDLIGTNPNTVSAAERFWQANNLPKGTANFVCKDSKAYLPNKVTDCRGNLISKQSGGIAQFKLNNNFPRYESGNMVSYTIFNCQGSNVIPVDYTDIRR